MVAQPPYYLIPMRDCEDQADVYFSHSEDMYGIQPFELFDAFFMFFHQHLTHPQANYRNGLPTDIYTYLTLWLTDRLADPNIEYDECVPMMEEFMELLYNQLFFVLRDIYSLERIQRPLEFLRWHGSDVMLIQSSPPVHQYRVDGAFTGEI